MSVADLSLLNAISRALDADPFLDPVQIGSATLSRAAARAAERRLIKQSRVERQAA